MPTDALRSYRVTQYALPDRERPPRNIGVTDLESLVTHHPLANRNGRLVDGLPAEVENEEARSYAVVGGELQEVKVLRTDRKYRSLAPDQVLLIKDFILDDPSAADSRRVDVPALVAGIVGRVDPANGVVDLLDPETRALVVRIRHLAPIAVVAGEQVAYGQSLGTQNNKGLSPSAGKHVHVEMDTRYYRQLDNYLRDLAEGRLPVQAERRAGVEPRRVVDDGVLRVGESGERIALVQRALVAGGYRAAGGGALDTDGVYRLSMQGAVLAFQEDRGLPPTADIDPPVWRAALDLALGKPLLPPPVFEPDSRPESMPGGFRLLEQLRGHIRDHEAARGRDVGPDGEQLALALAGRAARARLSSVDHLVFAPEPVEGVKPDRVLLVQGRLDDPAQRRLALTLGEALAAPPGESLRALEAAGADRFPAGPEAFEHAHAAARSHPHGG